ncbi:MAG: prolyl oligopeptidase family serine peptidase [Gemmatimonadetes bacterium]|nr:prolyl oligopeptidase family serine peptidase [Gemmatimonadota bacterium]
MRTLPLRVAVLLALGLTAAWAQTGGTARVRTRSYFFTEVGRNSDYKLFVSSRYQTQVPAPLIVALHPFATSPERILLYQGLLGLAEERGYLAVAPTGFDTRAWYASEGSAPGSGGELSERDVMNVLAAVREQYTVDPNRIYLMGHSMGGGGTWHLGIKYRDVWAALAPVAPAISSSPDALEAIIDMPVIVVQGTADPSVDVAITRRWVAKMQELGMTYEYVEVPGGDHTAIISRSPETMRKIFDFFDQAGKAR